MSSGTISASYRADIDGLRAVAILSVLAFHAFPSLATSGFYGVDVFFVISGYLIGGIILRQLEERQFSFIDFYGRRVRRIFPALLAVLAATLVGGWFVLLPTEYVQLGNHVTAASVFISNFFLWTEAGYFDAAIEMKPLMHLWSLGVEEQFYIVWPFLLLVTCLWRNALPFMLSIALASFVAMLVAERNDTVAAFYLPVFRFWELMVGSILAGLGRLPLSQRLALRVSARLREIIGLIGVAMILWAMTLPEGARVTVGAWALVPTIGTVLAIVAGPSTWINRRALGNRLARGIGLISYPLYLWHWPLISLVYIIHGPALLAAAGGSADGLPPLSWRVGAVAASLVLAVLTYVLIEKPLRFGSHTRSKAVGLCGAMIVVGCLGLGIQLRDGFRSRLPEILRNVTSDYRKPWRSYICDLDPFGGKQTFADECIASKRPSVLLWGDSLSAALYPGFNHYLPERGYGVSQLSGCPPILGFDRLGWKACPEMTASEIATIIRVKPDVLVMVGNWPETHLDGLQQTIERLTKNGVENIVLLGPLPYWRGGFPRVVLSYVLKHGGQAPPPRLPFGDVVINPELDSQVEAIARATNIRFVSMYDTLCNRSGCLTGIGEASGDLMVYDRFHFTVEGSLFVVPKIIDAVLGTGK
jgi:peptidoglycan/LPS O-acetylase OafA/YrhL